MEKLFNRYFVVLMFLGQLALAQEKAIFGIVIDPVTNKGIPDINIINKKSGEIVSTNKTGDYYIHAVSGDSIIISTFGYNRKGFIFDGKDKNPTIFVKQQPTLLREVVITDRKLSDLHGEINDFMDNPYNSKAIRNEVLKNMLNTNVSSPGAGIGISIDALYDLFSKAGKDKRKLADLQYNVIKDFYKNLRYNKQIVTQITHLQNEELDDFMTFCRPADDFILRSSDYELTFKILKCLGDFNKTRIYRKLR